MTPEPISIREDYRGSGKLEGRVALISGGDSGIGRAVALHFAREGADVAIIYLEETEDAKETQRLVEKEGAECLLIQGDVGDPAFCERAVRQTVDRFGALHVLVNNAAQQYPEEEAANISEEQLEQTFRVNVFGYMFLTQAALDHLGEHGSIINTGSITGVRGSKKLVDYSATKGAIQAMTYSLAQQLIERGVRVNGVAPGPVWTPLIPATFPPDDVANFGKDTPMKRPAQPAEVAPAYVFLASEDASYINGQFIHINGGSYMH
jgi:NAD(P)-dependent dehydrogenase (short-subunit alcohol dehydrogenase family)